MKPESNNNHKKVLALLRRGDPFALELMYDLFAPILYGAAIKIVQSEKNAGDLIQKVLLYFYNNHSTFDENKQNIYLWLISVLRMYAEKKMHLVSHSPNQKPLFYVNTSNLDIKEDNPPLFKNTDDGGAYINADQKNILDLVFFGGKKLNAVANSLGINENELRKLIREAVNKHRKEKGTWK